MAIAGAVAGLNLQNGRLSQGHETHVERSRPIASYPQLEVIRTPLNFPNPLRPNGEPSRSKGKRQATKAGQDVKKDHAQSTLDSASISGDGPAPTRVTYHIEYRVYNFRLLKSGRVKRGDDWSIIGITAFMVTTFYLVRVDWTEVMSRVRHRDLQMLVFDRWRAVLLVLGLVALLVYRSRVVLYQSLNPLPDLGIQLSTTRGVSFPHPSGLLSSVLSSKSDPTRRISLVLSTSPTFIPLSQISTVVINEGLKRWSVRYFLAIIKRKGQGVVVAFDHVTPPLSVLREVYHGVRESLFDEYDE